MITQRYNPDIKCGLSTKEVNDRKNTGLINTSTIPKTKTKKQIVFLHIFTLFNILNLFLGLCIVLVHSYRNLLFLGVVFCNTIIGIFQELRAKKIVDKLSIISEKKVTVIRNSKKELINFEEVVLDDIVEYKLGNQIIADSIILSGSCEVNESFITGESNPILKKKGDYVLSGSFIVSGSIITKTEKVGSENYVSTISDGAKYVKKLDSEIMLTINKIIKILSFVIIPLGVILFFKQWSLEHDLVSSVVNTVAALIGMIPEGLVLLTSSVFMVSIIRLSKYNVLVQELYCIENLARVDTLCLDKTGTITEGSMEIYDIIPFEPYTKNDVEKILVDLSFNIDDENPTIMAIKDEYKKGSLYNKADDVYNFSSEKKFSGIRINNTSYLLGAFDYLLQNEEKETANSYSSDNRVLAVVKSINFDESNLRDNKPIGLLLIRDKIRKNAVNTINYFKSQNVDIKIISGDNPVTVSHISKSVGIVGYDKYIDASTLITDEDIYDAASKYNIFGRVKPDQKKKIVQALKQNGNVVGYVGDGVNDVLALKESDCSITFQNGSEAARNVSQLVLLDSNFHSIPKIVAEGRRTINNIERSATLFLVKTIYSSLLAIIFLFLNQSYPFIPIQLTLTSVVTIGIPSFILALEPNKDRVEGHFFPKVISKSLPAALTIVANILITIIVRNIFNFNDIETSTTCVILTGLTGFILLYRISKPFNIIRITLLITMITVFLSSIIGFRNIFELAFITPYMGILVLVLTIISYVIFNLMMNLIEKYVIPKIK